MTTLMWFGTTGTGGLMRWVPMPSTGMTAGREGWSTNLMFEDGGANVVRSSAMHRIYEMDFPAQENLQLDVFADYAYGLYGTGLIYFVDPMIMDQNIVPPNWAAPMLCLNNGFPHIGTYASDAATAANSYSQPNRSVTYSITTAANAIPTDPAHYTVIPVPPGHTLKWGFSGSTTGTGRLAVSAHRRDGAANNVYTATALSVTGSTRFNGTNISGDTHDYVTMYLTRTDSSTSTVTVASIMAALGVGTGNYSLPADVTNPRVPYVPLVGNDGFNSGKFIGGRGATGCRFDGTVMPETYMVRDEGGNRRLVGMSATLRETGAWE